MLVLTRKLNEKIVFPGTNISVQVLKIKPGKVGLGVDAPSEVTILREEIPDRQVNWGEQEKGPQNRPENTASGTLPSSGQKLKALSKDLGLARLQLRLGQSQTVQASLDRIHQDMQALLRQLETKKEIPLELVIPEFPLPLSPAHP
ncbi:MAG TPA: carbon storage regulator [Gemmataceae bacterium]|nr:carbon storage regulator [Gemmataceae bacterium]